MQLTRDLSPKYKNSSYSSIKKKKKAQSKLGKQSKQTFLQRRHINGQRHMKKSSIFSVITEMQIQHTMSITSHQSDCPSLKNVQIIHSGQYVKKKEPSYTIDRNVNWNNHCEEKYGGSLKN